MWNLQGHRLIKQPQHRFVKEPVFELEARAEYVLPDEHPNCTVHGLGLTQVLEVGFHVRSGRQGEFFADAVPDMLRHSRPEPLSLLGVKSAPQSVPADAPLVRAEDARKLPTTRSSMSVSKESGA